MVKKIIFLGLLLVFLAPTVFAQEKIEAPVWNVGDKWVFTGEGSIEVINADQNSYTLKFSDGICVAERQGHNTIIFGKPTISRTHFADGGKRQKYVMGLSKIFDFPLSVGKQWKYGYSSPVVSPWSGHKIYYDYSENFKVLSWEDVQVRAGKFKTLRLEYKRVASSSSAGANIDEKITNQYWYSPDVKYFVKCQYDKDYIEKNKEVFNWELTALQSKK